MPFPTMWNRQNLPIISRWLARVATLTVLVGALPAAEYYIQIHEKAVKHVGRSQIGPFPTREAAEAAFVGWQNNGGTGIIKVGNDNEDGNHGSKGTVAAAPIVDQHAVEQQRLDEERLQQKAADKKAADAAKQAAFERDHAAALKSLKGSSSTSANGGLKGSDGQSGLKGTVRDPGLKSSDPREPNAMQARAWRQLHCASVIAGYALDALQTRGDHDEFGTLSIEALKALDGQRIDVQCGEPPPFPDLAGKEVDMEQVKATERLLIKQATAIAGRMKERKAAQPTLPAAPTSPETPEEKMRRVQKELNAINSQKIDGATQRQIDQQRKDQEDLAKLVLINNGFSKGNVSVVIDLGDLAEPPPPPPPPSPTP